MNNSFTHIFINVLTSIAAFFKGIFSFTTPLRTVTPKATVSIKWLFRSYHNFVSAATKFVVAFIANKRFRKGNPSFVSSGISNGDYIIYVNKDMLQPAALFAFIETGRAQLSIGGVNAFLRSSKLIAFTIASLFLISTSFAQTINKPTVPASPYCAGQTITVSFTTSGGAFTSGNVFTAELSKPNGGFTGTGPVSIGTVTSTGSGTGVNINATIPAGAAAGSGYRIRILSSNPSRTSVDDNGTDLVINALPVSNKTVAASSTSVCSGSGTNITIAASESGVSYQLRNDVNNSTIGSAVSGNGGTINLPTGNLTSTTTFNVLATTATGCNVEMTTTPTVTVTANVTPTVTIASSTATACAGTSVTFTATATNTGGGTVTYTFKEGATTLRTASTSNTFTTSTLSNGSHTVTADISISGGTCLTATTATTTTGAPVTVSANVTPTVTIASSTATACAGTSVTFTATANNTGGGTVTYTFKEGATVLQAASTSNTFTTSTLSNGSHTVTSDISITGGTCLTATTATTTTGASVTVSANVTPTVSIASSTATACAGTSVTFTATATNAGGGTVTYTFKEGATVLQAASTSNTFTTSTLSNGSHTVTADISISGGTCLTATTATTTTGAPVTVSANVTPTVTIASSTATACAGTSVTFTATAANTGGGTVTYTFKEGATVLQAASTSNTFTTSTLSNGSHTVTSDISITGGTCLTATTATTTTGASVTVSANVTPTVSIASSTATACAGTSVTFTATATNTGGGTVTYTFKEGATVLQAASTSNTFTTSALSNGSHTVTADISISGGTCLTATTATATTGAPVTVSANVTPTVSIVSSTATACAGTSVTFTATATNTGGGTVTYTFKEGATTLQTGASNTYTTTTLSNGSHTVTSDISITGGTCLTATTATTTTGAPVTVSANVTPTVTIASSTATACAGTSVTFTATAANTGGGTVTYTFKEGTTTLQTGASNTYTTTTLSNGSHTVTSDISITGGTCLTTTTASTPNGAEVTVSAPSVGGTIAGSTTVCTGGSGGTLTLSGETGSVIEWQSSTTNFESYSTIVTTEKFFNYPSLTITTKYRAVVKSGACDEAFSSIATITVTPAITDNAIGSAQTVNSGSAPAPLTGSTPAGGSGSFTYAWESSTTSASTGFTAAAGTNNTKDYSPAALTQNTWFRRVVTSGGCTSTSDAIAITINHAPVATNGTASGAEDAASITGTASATDVDGNTLTYSLIDNVTAAEGVLTFNPNGSYSFAPALNFNGTATFTFRASDGTANSNTSTITITVTPVNDAPVGVADAGTTDEDVTLNGTSVLGNDTDVDDANSALTAELVANADPAKGTVTLNANGTYSFVPAANFNGTATFTYRAKDAAGAYSAATTVTITVNAVNDAPVSVDGSASGLEDAAAITGNAVATDVDGNTLTYSVVTNVTAAEGVLTFNPNGSYSFAPALNFNGTATFTFRASDGTANSNTSTITITVTPVNDAPVSVDGSASGLEDAAAITGNAVATDVDGNTLTYSVVTNVTAAQGVLTFNPNGSYSFAPALNFNGTATFTFRASDGTANSNTSTITITVTPVNDAPVGVADAGTTDEDVTLNGTSVLGNDTDVDDANSALTAELVANADPAKGTVTLNANGTYSFVPAANFNGTATFTYRAKDAAGAYSAATTVTITVNAVNDAPVSVDGSASGLEDAAAITGNAVATDVDGNTLTYSVVTNVTAAQGVLTFNPNGSYSFAPALNFNGTATFTFRASDGTANSNTSTITITVTPVNDAPVGVADAGTTDEDVTLNGTSVLGNDTDVDDANSALTAELVANADPAKGTVTLNANGTYSFVPAANFNGTATFTYRAKDAAGAYSAATTVTITVNAVNDAPVSVDGSASGLEDAAAITGNAVATDVDGNTLTYSVVTNVTAAEGVLTFNPNGSYSFAPALNFNGTATFTFRASDGTANSNTSTITITVTPVNDAPVSVDGSASGLEDAAAITGNAVATDVDGNTLTYSVVTNVTAAQGVLTFNPNGSYSFAPALNFNGTATFTFRASDGTANSNTSTITITVTPVNDAPVGVADAGTTDEDVTLNGTSVLGNDTDVDDANSALTAELVANADPAKGTVTLNANGTYSFVPAANFNGTATFTYRAKDAAGAYSAATTVTITVNAVNDAPVSVDGSASGLEDAAAITGNAVATDVDGNTLTYSVVTNVTAAEGVLTFNPNGSYSFAPALNFNGTATFTFRASDGTANSNTSTITITVTPVNDAPVSVDGSASGLEDAAAITGNAVATDVDGNTLTYSVVTNVTAAQGVLTFNPNGSYSFAPALNFNGTATFTFRASDGTANSNTSTITITVTPVNDAPVGVADAGTTDEDVTLNGTSVLGNDTDVDDANSALTAELVANADPAKGTVTLNANGTYSFVPAANFNGTATFTYRAKDAAGAYSAATTVTITVNAVNDAPVSVDGSASGLEDAAAITGNAVATDVDGNTLTYSVVTNVTAAEGVLTFNPNGSYSFAPALNFNGTATFTFRASDGTANSNTSTITITVTPVNDAPVSVDGSASGLEDAAAITGNAVATDVDGNTLTYSVVTNVTAAQGVLTFNPNGSYSFAPALNFNGTATFTFRASDGTANSNTSTITITVTPVNDAPVGVADAGTTDEDVTLNGTSVLGNDTDVDDANSALTAELVANADPAKGTVTLNANGTYSFVPAANFNGTATFTYRAKDAAGAYSAATTVTITVNAVNDAPVSVDGSASGLEDAAAITGNAVATDVDGNTLTYSVVTNVTAAEGVLTFNPNGSYSFAPALNFNGTATFTFRASDGTANSNTSTITITVTPVNDAPVSVDGSASGLEDAAAITGNAVATDVDGNTLTYSVVTNVTAAQGVLTFNPNGSYSFAPALNFNGTATFTFRASDGTANSNTSTITITVTPVNDAPVGVADAGTTDEDVTLNGTSVLGNDTDVDDANSALTAELVANADPAKGTVTLNANGTYSFVPAANFNGTATFTYRAKDAAGAYSAATTVTITVNAVNDAPTLDALSNPAAILEDAAEQSVSLSGIGTGAANETQTLVVTATSSNPSLIPNPTVVYTSPNATGSLKYTPVANANGTAIITVTVNDGGTANATVTKTFTVTVDAVNDAPTLNAISNPAAILEDAAEQSVSLSGIGTGAANETQTLVVTATSSNPSLIPNPTVVYTSPNATGSLKYTPVANESGTAIITVTVNDGGAENATVTKTFTVTVTAVNDAPTLDAISNPAAILEDAAEQTVSLSGIGTGAANETQTLVVTATSSNPLLIPNPTVVYTSPNATGSLKYTPVANANGTAIITVTVNDGGIANATVTKTFTVTVDAVNDAPTLNAISNPAAILEDAAEQSVSLSGIGTGAANETQTLVVTATSSNPLLIPNPTVVYTSPNATGSLKYTPVANANGTAIITVTVNDGGTANATVTKTFTVTVDAVNDAPTLNAISNPAAILEDAAEQSVSLSGIGTGAANETQTLVVTATSSNPSLIPNPTVVYTSPNATGSLKYTPVANESGTAIITVTVNDGGAENATVTKTFTVTVTAVNDAPTLDAISNPAAILEDAAEQTVSLSGIGTGAANETQTLVVTATSSNPLLIPNPTVVYTSPNATGSLKYTPVANANGTAIITVTVNDGGTANATVTKTFTVTVTAVNDAPTLNAISNPAAILEDAAEQSVSLSGIGTGAANETQTLVVTATSSNPSLIPNPTVVYTSPNATGSLKYTPVANANGTAIITVTVNDGGAENATVTKTFTVTVTAVNDAPVVSNDKATQSVQYSDPIVPVTITATDVDNNFSALTATASWKLSSGTTFTMGLVGTGLVLTKDATNWSVKGAVTLAPGTYTVRVTVDDGSSSNNTGYTDFQIVVNQEDARVTFTGTQLVATQSSTSGVAMVTLRATVQDISVTSDAAGDTNSGDIRNARVRFLNGTTPIVISGVTDANGWLVPTLVNASDLTTGIVSLNWSVDIGKTSTDEEYTISMEVGGAGYYTRNSSADNTVVTVYKPVGDFITGGGSVLPTLSAGTYASATGTRTNFGFNVKYNKSGTNLQGNMNIIFRRMVGTVLHTYQIKSNAMSSLGVNIANPSAQTAVFVAKANLTDITNPLAPQSLGGNLDFQVNMTDKGEPGTSDMIAMSLYSGSTLLYSSNWVSNKTAEMLLSGGNLVVRSGFSVGTTSPTTTMSTTPESITIAPAQQLFTERFSATAYPNPTVSYFTIKLSSGNTKDAIAIRVIDEMGRLVEIKNNLAEGQTIQIGQAYRSGIYFVEVMQGNTRRQLKLIKNK